MQVFTEPRRLEFKIGDWTHYLENTAWFKIARWKLPEDDTDRPYRFVMFGLN
jgi:hypothetical protein